MEGCRGILLGRTTYEMFEPAWSQRTAEDDPGAPFFNETTKYVVSATLTTTTWRNSQLLGPYDPATISRLKNETDGDLYVSGSGTLVRAMLASGLVDELNLFVYPLTRGTVPRLFAEDASPHKMTLAASEAHDNGAGVPQLPRAELAARRTGSGLKCRGRESRRPTALGGSMPALGSARASPDQVFASHAFRGDGLSGGATL
jgi:dihydrofolate reductase